MTVRVSRLPFGRVPEQAGNIGIAFDVGLSREV